MAQSEREPEAELNRRIAEAESDEGEMEPLVRQWLLNYAWLGTGDEKERTVACIMAQGDWRALTARADRRAGAQEETGPEVYLDSLGFEISALYECHDGPHQATCPAGSE